MSDDIRNLLESIDRIQLNEVTASDYSAYVEMVAKVDQEAAKVMSDMFDQMKLALRQKHGDDQESKYTPKTWDSKLASWATAFMTSVAAANEGDREQMNRYISQARSVVDDIDNKEFKRIIYKDMAFVISSIIDK